MQIVNLFPLLYSSTFVITFCFPSDISVRCFPLVSTRFIGSAIWCRAFMSEFIRKGKKEAKKIEIKLKFTARNLCRYVIYERNLLYRDFLSFFEGAKVVQDFSYFRSFR